MMNILRKFWSGWKKFAHRFGMVQTEIILFLFYFLIYVPVGLVLRLIRYDPLRTKLKKKSNWQDAKIGRFDMDKYSHQS